MDFFFLVLLGAVLVASACAVSAGQFVDVALELTTGLDMLEAVEVDVAESQKSYRKFPTINFLSFSREELIPKLLFLDCRVELESFFISESRVARMSLLRFVDLRSKAN